MLALAVTVLDPAGFWTSALVASHDLTGTCATRVASIAANRSEHALHVEGAVEGEEGRGVSSV